MAALLGRPQNPSALSCIAITIAILFLLLVPLVTSSMYDRLYLLVYGLIIIGLLFLGAAQTLTLATLNITSVKVKDEGYYWCELKSATSQSLLSDKYPLHVYYKPKDPTVRQIGRDVVQEDTITTVAECGSKASCA